MGIDDFAFKKRFTYGTLFIDLQTRKPVDMLDTRQPTEVTEWLQKHPEIELITRDGSKLYAAAVKAASPTILQVADRWHLLHQLFDALKNTIGTMLPAKWVPPGTAESVSNQDEVTIKLRKHELKRIQNQDQKWSRIQQVQSLYKEGYSKADIQRQLGLSFATVAKYLDYTEKPEIQRTSAFQQFRPLIRTLILEKRPSGYIEEACRSNGFNGSISTLNNMISNERKQAKKGRPIAISIRQKVIHILWDTEKAKHLERINNLHPEILKTFPQLIELDELVHSFRKLVKEKKTVNLMDWLANIKLADFSFVQSFANGILQDLSAIKLSIEKDWSNGPTEGQINRLKMIKRMMYGRAGFQVLRNRILYQW
ncbi:ISL3 family transposase [Planococcus sp. ISL-109]|uniref:ISL3 family transposase n=1 Tax=Planococcus sp. ISL-109 TaxID=2819166 RepID=UPI001BE5BDE3|nr:ISL3 family transposase [Planococcus sp. ISL-109]